MTSQSKELPTLVAVLDEINEANSCMELIFMAAAEVGGTETAALRYGICAAQERLKNASAMIWAIQGGAA